jgi:hypothetical protein
MMEHIAVARLTNSAEIIKIRWIQSGLIFFCNPADFTNKSAKFNPKIQVQLDPNFRLRRIFQPCAAGPLVLASAFEASPQRHWYNVRGRVA